MANVRGADLPAEERQSSPGMPVSPVPPEPLLIVQSRARLLRAGWLMGVLVAVVVVDWGSKALAWRLLPGAAVINADTSGALPILPGLVSQPVFGAVVDAAVLLLVVLAGFGLSRATTLGTLAWTGSALVWAGIVSNAADRWIGHLWLAPGSRRGVVDWIGVPGRMSINLADVVIGCGLVLAIAALTGTRIPRKARAAVAAGVLLLVPVSALTTSGASSNALPVAAGPTFGQQARATLLIGSKYQGRRVVWRQPPLTLGWNVTVDAVDEHDLVVARWHLPWDSKVGMLQLPKNTHTIYVTHNATGEVITLVTGLS